MVASCTMIISTQCQKNLKENKSIEIIELKECWSIYFGILGKGQVAIIYTMTTNLYKTLNALISMAWLSCNLNNGF